ncbi:hypothetical protein JTB14_029450 [Gonioctena quinquepunctata]|nr:hypothetical protein JTB14_029450 [Gonioctena quinquepunctata]
MVYIIPDKVLEKLICDNCHKYLSVKPVKVYSNRKTKCGRCCETEDGGVVSLYGLLAESSLFKCVNRFDGCRKLLAYQQVKEHEKKCIGEKYFCPICTETNQVPTYLLYKHFEEEHNENLLKFPTFLVDADDYCNVTKTFLYRIENNLFFINSKIDLTNGYILLNALQVQKHSNSVNKQKFILNDGKKNIFKTPRKACDSLDSQEFAGFRIKLPEIISQSMRVEFEIDTTDSTELIGFSLADIIPESSQSQHTITECEDDEEKTYLPHLTEILPDLTDTQPDMTETQPDVTETQPDLTETQPDLTETQPDDTSKFLQPRRIFLNDHFRKSHHHYIVNHAKDGLRSSSYHLDVFLYCFKCREISQNMKDYKRGFFYKYHKYHFICFYCHEIDKSRGTKSICSEFLLDYAVFKEIEYFCFWKCGKSFNNEEIVDHETKCSRQPLRECPRKYCYYRATIYQLIHHFQEDHKKIKNDINIYSGNFLTNSRFSPRPISINYIWLFNVLVRIDFHHRLLKFQSISNCGDKSDVMASLILLSKGAQPMVLNEGSDWVSIPEGNTLVEPIKCYLQF